MRIRAITWNLFHGRDAPPGDDLGTWRSRLRRQTEHGDLHVQVNRELLDEFIEVLGRADWDVALLQECPPRWATPLAEALDADAHRALTSRNRLGRVRGVLAKRNPDLLASAEGGSNLTLIRGQAGSMGLGRELELRPRPSAIEAARGAPERRVLGFVETTSGLCVANLHATNDRPELADEEVRLAARAAGGWTAGRPLIFGGDFNLRPEDSPAPFQALAREHGLAGTPVAASIDHLFAGGLGIAEPAQPWPPAAREVPDRKGEGDTIRLSDHAPVEACFIRT